MREPQEHRVICAVHTRPNMEKKADQELRRLSCQTFYPFAAGAVRRAPGKKAEKRVNDQRPQFSRYLSSPS